MDLMKFIFDVKNMNGKDVEVTLNQNGSQDFPFMNWDDVGGTGYILTDEDKLFLLNRLLNGEQINVPNDLPGYQRPLYCFDDMDIEPDISCLSHEQQEVMEKVMFKILAKYAASSDF